MKRFLITLMVAAVACTWVGSAQAQKPLALTNIGVVDYTKIRQQYTVAKRLEEQRNAFRDQQQAQLNEELLLAFLTEAERKQYDTLKAVAAPTAEQTKQLEGLRTTSQQRDARLTQLEQLTTPTDQEKAEREELRQRIQSQQERLNKLRDDLQDKVAQEEQRLIEDMLKVIDQALRDVAKQEKVDFVFDKAVLLFGGKDITDKVLEKLGV